MKERELNNEREKERERKWGNRTGNQPSTFFSKWIKNFNNFFSTTNNTNNSCCCGRIRVDQIKSKESQLASNKSEESSETLILVQKRKKRLKTKEHGSDEQNFFLFEQMTKFLWRVVTSPFLFCRKEFTAELFFVQNSVPTNNPSMLLFFLLQVFECLVMTKGQSFYHPSYHFYAFVLP